MSSEDWYRNKKWNRAIESAFYEKLKRSRSQRDQYIVIQALTLTDTYPEVTLRLVEEYFRSRKNNFDDVRALLARANSQISLNNIEGAVKTYHTILEQEAEFPNHKTSAYLDYPYMVATLKIENEFDNAIKVLNENIDRLTFPLDYFKWHAAMAFIKEDGTEASKALKAAQVKKSGFSFHQNVGLVGKEYKQGIKELCKIST